MLLGPFEKSCFFLGELPGWVSRGPTQEAENEGREEGSSGERRPRLQRVRSQPTPALFGCIS